MLRCPPCRTPGGRRPRLASALAATLAAASTLLFVAAVALWVRSYWITDFVWYGQIGSHIDRLGAITEPGTIHVFADNAEDAPADNDDIHYSNWPASGRHSGVEPYMDLHWDGLGFRFVTDRFHGFLRCWDFAVPHWFVALMSLPAPLLYARAWRRRRRVKREGLCPACGYDLRATPDRCPECGRVGDGKGDVGTNGMSG
jgi:hypothetical protein